MIQLFFLIGLPYLALAALVIGTAYRLTKKEYSVSSLSSQFLESKFLVWGSVPWHLGILVLFFGHLIPLLLPSLWQDVIANREALLTVEAIGFIAGIFTVVGLVVLILRRIFSRTLQIVTKPLDFVMYALLLVQIILGMLTAYNFQYGAAWATGTLYAYLYSIFSFSPNAALVQDMPAIIQAHVILAWTIVALIPFTRLIHMFSIPVEYFMRLPQLVIWSNESRWNKKSERAQFVESRRYFIRGAAGIAGASGLLSIGVLEKTGKYFQGEKLDDAREAALLEKRLKRMKLTVEEKTYELERLKNDSIFVSDLKELTSTSGKYFIDYEMNPALAFKTSEGLPNLISAKCTHLGCTVGKDVNSEGNILCPCHVSYFDSNTGIPKAGSPTQISLKHIEWMLQDDKGNIVARGAEDGSVKKSQLFDAKNEALYKVFITKKVITETV